MKLISIGEEIQIPKLIYDILLTSKAEIEVEVNKDEPKFILYGIKQLTSKIKIDGCEYFVAEQLKGFSKTLVDIYGENTYDQNENPYSLDRLANSIAIGYRNTQVLFVDIEFNNQISIFYPAGGDVEHLDITLEEFRK